MARVAGMAGDWIKLEHVTPDKPEVHRIAEVLAIDPDAVTGKLVRLWIWADQQTTDGNANVTTSFIDRVTGQPGFGAAMEQVGWLATKRNGDKTLPNFRRHNGASAKKRAESARRASIFRNRERNADRVTPALQSALPREEKRREEKSIQKSKKHSSVIASDENFLESLKSNPAYRHIDLETELGRMRAWLALRPGRQLTPRFVVNWLNKVERPIGAEHGRNGGGLAGGKREAESQAAGVGDSGDRYASLEAIETRRVARVPNS